MEVAGRSDHDSETAIADVQPESRICLSLSFITPPFGCSEGHRSMGKCFSGKAGFLVD